MRVERRVEIGAAPDAVYRLVMDPRRLADWVTVHAGLPEAPKGELRKGSKLKQSLKLAGQSFDVRWTVVTADRPRRVVWEGRGPLRTRARVVYELEPSGEGTSFGYVNEYELPGGPVGKIGDRALAGTAEREADRSLERLKALLEG